MIDHFYGNEPGSLSGNDDCGQMSAWYIFNCMGFYPTAPSSNIYNIGSPALEAVTMRLGNGHQVKVTTENWSKQNVYVEKMLLNGKEYDKSYITYDDIRDGADHPFRNERPAEQAACRFRPEHAAVAFENGGDAPGIGTSSVAVKVLWTADRTKRFAGHNRYGLKAGGIIIFLPAFIV